MIAAASLLAVSLFAADVSGTWSGDVKLPNGQLLPFVAHLKQEGGKITGKLDGINRAPDVEYYTAKASGDMLDFKILREDGQGPRWER